MNSESFCIVTVKYHMLKHRINQFISNYRKTDKPIEFEHQLSLNSFVDIQIFERIIERSMNHLNRKFIIITINREFYLSNHSFFIYRHHGILLVSINFGQRVIFTEFLNNKQCDDIFNVSDCIIIHKLYFRVEKGNLLLIIGVPFHLFLTL